MEITGRIILVLPEVTGVSKAGRAWKKKEFVIETQDSSFPRRIHFDLFGDNADRYPIAVGDTGTLSFDIESREYNGRWFTQIRGWGWRKEGEGAVAPQPFNAPAAPAAAPLQGGPGMPPPPPAAGEATDDLPF